jgi:hypothetical protein
VAEVHGNRKRPTGALRGDSRKRTVTLDSKNHGLAHSPGQARTPNSVVEGDAGSTVVSGLQRAIALLDGGSAEGARAVLADLLTELKS